MAAMGLLGLVLVVGPDILHGQLPGDFGDARFNLYLLENFTQRVMGKVPSFWNAGFFYPFPLTIAFSDNFLGNGFIFAALRLLGFDGEDAFRGWFALGYVINFAACAYALQRLGYGALAASAGAFLFTFALPVTAQENHVQLVYRFGVPLAALSLVQFAARPHLKFLAAALFWTVWEFYCSIYLGYFLCLFLAALAISLALCRNDNARAAMAWWPLRFDIAWKNAPARGRIIWVLVMLDLVTALTVLLMPYLRVSHIYGFQRDIAGIETMLPRLASYLYTNNSRLWQFDWSQFDALPMRWEHPMFIGAAPFMAVAAAMALRTRQAPADADFLPMAGAIALLFVVTLFIAHHSLYAILALAPGANAIRAVTRIGTVMLFPSAVLMASGLDALLELKPGIAGRATAILIGALMIVECSFVTHVTSGKKEWRDRIAVLEAQLPKSLPAAPILMVAADPSEESYKRELDAMLLAQIHGWQTLNGYSGNTPPGHAYSQSCQDAARNIEAGLTFIGHATGAAYHEIAARIVRVGYGACDIASLMHTSFTSEAGPLPPR